MTTKRIKIIVDAKDAKKVVKALDADIDDLDVTVNKTNKAFGGLKKVVAAVGAVLLSAKVIKYSDAYKSLQNQLRQTTDTQQELLEVTEKVLELSNRSRSSIETTSNLYTQLKLSTEELGFSQDELLRITETINKSFVVSGATAQEASGAIRQLVQGFAAGALRGDEFNSVAEQAPEILRAIARTTGKSIGELREFAAQGGITAELLTRSLEQASDVIDRKFANSTRTFDQSLQIAQNNMTAFIGKVEEGSGGVDGLGNSIVKVSEILNDPSTIAAAQAFSKAIVTGFGLVIETAKETVNFVTFVSEEIAAFVGGAAVGDIVRLESELESLRTKLAVMKRDADDFTLYGLMTDDKDIAEVEREIASVEAKLKLSRELAEGAAKARIKEAKATAEAAKQAEENLTDAVPEALKQNIIEVREQLQLAEALVKSTQQAFEAGITTEATVNEEKARVAEIRAEYEKLKAEAATFSAPKAGKPEPEVVNNEPEAPQLDSGLDLIRQEKARTEALKLELDTRRSIEQGYNELRLIDKNDYFAQEKALITARQNEEAALADQKRMEERAQFELDLAQVAEDERLTAEAKRNIIAELAEQEAVNKQMHEDTLTNIERQAAEERVRIKEMEEEAKLSAAQSVFGNLSSLMGTESRKLFKIGKVAAIAEASISGYRAAVESYEYGASIGGPPLGATMATASAIATGAQIAKIKSQQFGGSGGQAGGFSAPSASTASQPQPVAQPQQSSVLEVKGLSRIAEELANFDPNEAIPVEFAQRIVAGLDEFNRLSGGNDA